jgi:hypothetical protein
MDEYELDSSITPWMYVDVAPSVIKSMQTFSYKVWRENQNFQVECQFRFHMNEPCYFNFFPAVIVTRIARDDVKKRDTLIGKELRDAILSRQHIQAQTNDDSKSDENLRGVGSATTVDKYLELLNTLYNKQMATMVLINKINTGMHLSQLLSEFSFSLDTMQKKGNLLYCRTSYEIHGIQLKINDVDPGSKLFVNMEDFFFGTKDDGVLTRVIVPSIDERSEAYAWINRWLSDFRVVL